MTRQQQLLKAVPDVLRYHTLLYVGASQRRQHMLPLFTNRGYTITVLEAWHRNAVYVAKHVAGVNRVMCGDVRSTARLNLGPHDVVMWWHGPEHIHAQDLAPTLAALEELALHVVVLASPWGRYDQDAVDGNPYERHLCAIYPDMLQDLGYKTSTLGKIDVKGSNLVAWRHTR